jgi:uncharacterized protein (TIRG00374 family)
MIKKLKSHLSGRLIHPSIKFVLRIFLSFFLMYLIIRKVNIEEVIDLFHTIEFFPFIIAILLYSVVQIISAHRWSLFLPCEVPFSKLISLSFIGIFFNNFLPTAIGGDVVKTYLLYKFTQSRSHSIASTFISRYLGFTATVTIGQVAYLSGINYIKNTDIFWIIPLISLSFIVMSFILWSEKVSFINKIRAIHEQLIRYKDDRKRLFYGFLLSLIMQIIIIYSINLLAQSISITISFTELLIYIPITMLVTIVPLSISGIGLREGTMVYLLAMSGVTSEKALALSLLWFFSMTIINLLGGLEYMRYGFVNAEDKS